MNIRRFSSVLRIAPLLFALLLPLLISACSFTPRDPKEVEYWTMDTGDINLPAEKAIVAAFNKSQSQYHVNLVPVPGNITDLSQLMPAVRGGTGPDVFYLDRFTASQFAAIGLLQDLTPFIQKDDPNLGQKYLPFAWGEVLFRDHPYALPFNTDSRVLFYNKDALQQAGIDPSVLDPSHGPITIDQLQQIAFKFNHKDSRGSYDRIGFVPWTDQASHTTWAMDFNAQFFDPKTCQITPTEPAMVKALQLQYDWAGKMGKEQVDTFFATFAPDNAPPTVNPFFSGHLAMTITGNWELQSLQEYAPKVHYGVTYIPVANAGDKPSTWSGGFALAMPQGSHNPDGAYKFMRFLTGAEGQRIYTKMTQQLPTWADLLNDKSLFPGNLDFFAQILHFSRARVPLPVGAIFWDQLSNAQDKMVLHADTPLNALQTVYKRVQPQLQQYCPL